MDRIEVKTGKCCGVTTAENAAWFEVVKKYDAELDFTNLREKYDGENKEGFVVRFKSGMRVKLKFEEYVLLHRIISEVTPLRIWTVLSEGGSLADVLEKVPDEIHKEIKSLESELRSKRNEIIDRCTKEFEQFKNTVPEVHTRKEAAEFFRACKYPSIMFKLYDKKEFDYLVWKKIRPKGDS